MSKLEILKDFGAKQMNSEYAEIAPVGFEFNAQWIVNPFVDETARFEFDEQKAIAHYGKENYESWVTAAIEYIKKTHKQNL